jgi:hypothetical protein
MTELPWLLLLYGLPAKNGVPHRQLSTRKTSKKP